MIEEFQGRMMGMRGRGFTPIENIEHRPGSRSRSESRSFENEDEDDSYNCEDDFDSSSFNKMDENIELDQKKKMTNDGQDVNSKTIKEKGTRTHYIPSDYYKSDDELFSFGISSGANFEKYDEIEVNVSGDNIPRKIENFEEAGLLPILLSNIKRSGYKKPTPIQKHALPIVMEARDLMACAQTGSGKTAAFLIPLVNSLLENHKNVKFGGKSATPELIIVSPTRELAIQICVEAKKFTFGSSLKTEICYGGTDVRYQVESVRGGCNILIATMGRLLDFLKKKVVSLAKVRHIVVDEADRMLENTFLSDIEVLFSHPSINKNQEVQILMFSATFPEEIQRLAINYLKNYLFLAVGVIGSACTDVEQKFYSVSKYEKRSKLLELLQEYGSSKTLVFVERKRTADIIAAFLSEKDFPSTSMHGDREQILREEALNDFKSGRMSILVATAVAGRGLDIKNVSHVINFDLPKSAEEYVHRIGRTGRVGNRGLASSFFDSEVDSALAPQLIRILTQAQQEVPEFLIKANNSGIGSTMFKSVKKDIRKGRNFNVLEVTQTHDEEVW